MTTKQLALGLLSILLLVGITGCIEESTTEDTTELSGPPLTDEDWNYFQFHYISGNDLFSLFNEGFQVLNTHISLYNPTNSSFLIGVNESNKLEYLILDDIAETISQNVSRYQPELATYTVSPYFLNHSIRQEQLFDSYKNLSVVFNSVYVKVVTGYEPKEDMDAYIDISEEMEILFIIEQFINLYMNDQLEYLAAIPDDVRAAWDDNDWSFME